MSTQANTIGRLTFAFLLRLTCSPKHDRNVSHKYWLRFRNRDIVFSLDQGILSRKLSFIFHFINNHVLNRRSLPLNLASEASHETSFKSLVHKENLLVTSVLTRGGKFNVLVLLNHWPSPISSPYFYYNSCVCPPEIETVEKVYSNFFLHLLRDPGF